MTVTFISNYINHHQIPFSNACYERLGEDYHFIQTEPMEEERKAMGWDEEGKALPYVVCLYEEEERCRKFVMESDILIAGWSRREDLIRERLEAGKITLRVSERIYREGQWKAVSPRGLIQKYKEHVKYRKSPVYLLCAGAYVASDFHLIGAYSGKMYKWGYFPETLLYTEEELEKLKPEGEETQIVWAGRFIPLKHPEFMVRLAALLKSKEKSFHIHMIGSGELETELRRQAKEAGVEELFTFYGFLEPEKVRKIMEKSHIHVFTSNEREGWGAVINEAMNSGCAEVVNEQVGAAPYLINQGINGLTYPGGSFEKMAEAVVFLLENPGERKRMGKEAFHTITGLWNAEHGAEELLRFAKGLLAGEAVPAKEGPLSTAPVIAPGKSRRKQDWKKKKERY